MKRARELLGRSVSKALEAARHMRSPTRETATHYAAGMRLRRESRGWSAEARSEHVLRQLQHAVRHAAATTQYYAERLRLAGFDAAHDFGFDDFARLPVLERGDVAANTAAMLASTVAPSQRKIDGTGGSTGVPLQYWSGPEERGWRLSGQDAFMETLGIGRGSSIAFLWGHHIDRRERVQWRDRIRDTVTNRRWFDCFRVSPSVFLEYHREMTEFAPSGIVAYASALNGMAETLLANRIRANYPTRRVVTGAEKLWPLQREHVEAAFAAPVHERYGSRDVGFIAGQLEGRAGAPFLVDWPNLLVEPETNDPQSAILITKLHADAMPMIRYRVGDVAQFPPGSRPGAPSWELLEVIGRQLDGLHLPDGRWVHGVGIPHLMKEQPLREFQIRQNADFSIDVLIVPNDRYLPETGEEILRVLRENLPGIPIAIHLVDEIERTGANKWRPVITHAVRSTTTTMTQESR